MCLAVPGRVVGVEGGTAVVDFLGNRQRVDVTLTPDVGEGEWVLVHAGFAITTLPEGDALETWETLREAEKREVLGEAGGDEVTSEGAGRG